MANLLRIGAISSSGGAGTGTGSSPPTAGTNYTLDNDEPPLNISFIPGFLTTVVTPPPGNPVPYVLSTLANVPSTIIFDDEFNETQLNTSVWTPHWYTATQQNNPPTTMNASNVTMGPGGVSLTLASNQSGGIITTNPNDGVAGHVGYWVPSPTASAPVYVEWSVNSAAVSGEIANWPSVWLEGVDQSWPTQGEIDIWEGLSGQAGYHTHWGSTDGEDLGGLGGFSGTSPGQHIYGALWSTTAVTWVYDGFIIGTHTFGAGAETTAMAFKKMLNAENALAISPPGTFASTPAVVTIRYCRVWQNGSVAPTLTISSIANQTGTVGTLITPISPSASGGTTPYGWAISNQPTGISINSTTGQITGTPNAAVTNTVTVTVTDHLGNTKSTNFVFTVTAGGVTPGAPVLNSPTVSGTQAVLTWSAASNAVTYSVIDGFFTIATGVTSLTYTATGLSGSNNFQVYGVNAQGTAGPDSNLQTVTIGGGSMAPHAPATINGVTVPTNVAWNDEFPGPHLDVTKWLPGWFGDRGGGTSSGSFGPNMTFLETNLSFTANGLAMTFTGTDGGACSSGLINSANWAGGAWTADATLGIPASGGPTFPGFVGWAGSPDGGGFGGTNPGTTGPIYVEFSIIPDGSGTTQWNWQQWWLVQQGPASSNYDAVDELDVMETFNETASTVWYDGYGVTGHRVQSVALESGASHTVGVMWASTWCCFVYDGVASPVYTFVAFTHPQPPMGIIVAQGFSAANGCVFHSPSVQTTRYVRVFR